MPMGFARVAATSTHLGGFIPFAIRVPGSDQFTARKDR